MSGSEERRDPGLSEESLVPVWNAPDEAWATMLCDFLREQGIEARAMPVQIPWLGGVETLHHGYWGRIEVLGKDSKRAAALIQDFLDASPERGAGSSGEEPAG